MRFVGSARDVLSYIAFHDARIRRKGIGWDCAEFGHLEVPGEDHCRVCGVETWGKCDVCQRPEKEYAAVGVAASRLGPVSLSYCRECLQRGADALYMYETVVEMRNWRTQDEGFREMVTWKDGRYMTVAEALPDAPDYGGAAQFSH